MQKLRFQLTEEQTKEINALAKRLKVEPRTAFQMCLSTGMNYFKLSISMASDPKLLASVSDMPEVSRAIDAGLKPLQQDFEKALAEDKVNPRKTGK